MSSFKKPKSNVYKRFLYISEDDVLNSLSGIEGGAIDEIIQKMGEEGSKGLGLEVGADVPGVGVAKAKGDRKKSQKLEEEIRRKRTIHSATIALLEKLHKEDAIGVIEGDYTPEIYEQLEENMPIEFRADIRIHPLHQLVNVAQGWSQLAQDFGLSKKEANEFTQVARQIESAFHGRDKSKKSLVLFAEGEESNTGYKLVIPIQASKLLVPVDELFGTATFVAQVDHIVKEDEEVLAARIVRNSPVLPAERDMMLEMLPALQELQDDSGIGFRVDEEDIILRKPAVILKPLCIYR
jgi:hypothetical protein